ncbi:aminopeptidase [Thermoanaerobacterium thermosaccharolyticum]|uniref:aminopeptidase n=1 Tax=Thermoanaerobacterium thermosaccharolyticum TaxID=1517 RepID=UPI003DA87161
MNDFVDISKKLLINCLGVKSEESLLVITDDVKKEIGEYIYEAGKELNLISMLLKIPLAKRSGEEPPEAVAEIMKKVDVIIAVTEHSLTHTKARKEAVEMGARVATMPGITKEMFVEGAITADYLYVEKITKKVAQFLTKGKKVRIEKDGHILEMSIEGRSGIESTGIYVEKGQSGNLPSGEAYIAPVEGTADGTILVDGSIVGLGKLNSPILLKVENGLLIDAEGERSEEWLKILGNSEAAKNVGEFGIGTNPKALLTGNILEDEKILGTIHVAFGSNHTFGGKVNAGVHLDAVVLNPTVYVDDKIILEKGKLVI